IRQENRGGGPDFAKFPVIFPVSREFGAETSSQLTASSASQSRLWHAARHASQSLRCCAGVAIGPPAGSGEPGRRGGDWSERGRFQSFSSLLGLRGFVFRDQVSKWPEVNGRRERPATEGAGPTFDARLFSGLPRRGHWHAKRASRDVLQPTRRWSRSPPRWWGALLVSLLVRCLLRAQGLTI